MQNLATQKMVQNVIDGVTPPDRAQKAVCDVEGREIKTTYAEKSEVAAKQDDANVTKNADGTYTLAL